ncbi:trans-4-hydroxy-L-proline dehydratase activase [Lachnospiraceae bacterium LCP25S3_G4]
MSMITSIQKYSIHDGDGIRTTIFFKGCPLKCVWCHNPETQNYQKQVLYDKERCVACGACVNACPNHAMLIKEEHIIMDRALCDCCGTCIDYCNLNLREIMGKSYSVMELVKEVKKDQIFYEESGGGVTLSGGEVMTMDMDYLESLVKALHKQGITITIDTCGYAPYENFQRILPYVHTFLYDIKVMNQELHKEYIGVENTLILENLKKLSKDGARIYIRIPTINEVNGNDASMKATIAYLLDHRINVAQVNLLPYHNTGAGKYDKMGKKYEGTTLHAPSKEEMEHFVQMFQEAGFYNTKIGG